MLLKIIYLVFVLSVNSQSEFDDINLLESMNARLLKLSAEQARQVKITEEIMKAMSTKDLKVEELKAEDFLKQVDLEPIKEDIKTERERQKNELDEQKKKAEEQVEYIKSLKEDIQTVKDELKSFTTELNEQKQKLESDDGNESLKDDFKALKDDLKNLTADYQIVKTEFNSLKTELDKQKKDKANKETQLKSLATDINRISKDGLENSHLFRSLKAEQDKLVEDSLEFVAYFCAEAKTSGVVETLISSYSFIPFKVLCDAETRGGRWTVILKRFNGNVNFYRKWDEYKNGFGELDGEFFLGLDKIHALTAERKQELIVVLEDFRGVKAFELYDEFAIGDEDELYKLHTLGKARGTAGDSLDWHRDMPFSTYDRDNDPDSINCASQNVGAWWYRKCHDSQLTGRYKDNRFSKGINWFHFRGYEYSLKKAKMMIRPILN